MKKNKSKSISVIIPAFNEQENIEKAVKRTFDFLCSIFEKFEIIVINDGSTDKTGEISERLLKSISNLKVLHHQQNKGMGAAVWTGIKNAENELIFSSCADLQFDIKELEKFLPFVEKTDVIIGYRLKREYSLYRKFNTAFYHFLIKLLFGLNVKDPAWVKLFKKKVFDEISIVSKGFFWEVEILVKAKRKGLLITEVGVHSHKRKAGEEKGKSPKRIIEIFFSMLRFWYELNFGK